MALKYGQRPSVMLASAFRNSRGRRHLRPLLPLLLLKVKTGYDLLEDFIFLSIYNLLPKGVFQTIVGESLPGRNNPRSALLLSIHV